MYFLNGPLYSHFLLYLLHAQIKLSLMMVFDYFCSDDSSVS